MILFNKDRTGGPRFKIGAHALDYIEKIVRDHLD